jgi:hypothetical protein
VLEALPEFLGAADEAVAKEAKRVFAKQGLAIQTGVSITKVATRAEDVAVDYTDAAGKAQQLAFDKLIVSIGRVPHTAGLNAAAVGLELDERGFVAVDETCRTNLAGVWAIGDVVRGPMLAHKAEDEGVAVAERIAGQHGHVDFNTVPWVIYTSPEIAWVGQTEQQLKAAGIAYRAGSFPFSANGRARALGDTTGFVKILADATTDRILGVHAIGPLVSELIAEAVVAMEFGAASEDLARICHAHPVALRSDQGGGARRRQTHAEPLEQEWDAQPDPGMAVASDPPRRSLPSSAAMNDADSPAEIGPRSGALIAWIDPILAARGTTLDPSQVAALERLQRLATESRIVPRRAPLDVEEVFLPAGGPARRLPLGRRRTRKELPDGRLLRDGRHPAQDARPLPRLHARCPRRSRAPQGRARSARDRRRAHRSQMAARLLRRVPRRRHCRCDDPRPVALGALRPRRGFRDDDELCA